jgi:hypothetical protein
MTLSAADRLAILEVITRADDAASRRDADAYPGLRHCATGADPRADPRPFCASQIPNPSVSCARGTTAVRNIVSLARCLTLGVAVASGA